MMDDKAKDFMLKTARKAIEYFFDSNTKLELKPEDVPFQELTEDGACFVTLTIQGNLRGCMGSLEARRPLIFDVIENALASAFGDPRFMELTKEELPKVKISISVLTKPEPLPVQSPEDLLNKLVPKKHGLILHKGIHRATFLPAVWEQIPKKEDFLSHLSMKAGLLPDGWKDPEMEFYTYESEEFSEK